jgi:predicted nucleic acid-binding protein
MIVVADTSPLNYLIRVGQSEVLHDLFDRVLAPNAVITEMLHSDAPPEVRAWAMHPPAWLTVLSPERIDSSLSPDLGSGEREAISLAMETNADVLLIDDRAGRQQAETRHIRVAGTLAVLLQASVRGQLDFRVSLRQLRILGFRISPLVEKAMLVRYERTREQEHS